MATAQESARPSARSDERSKAMGQPYQAASASWEVHPLIQRPPGSACQGHWLWQAFTPLPQLSTLPVHPVRVQVPPAHSTTQLAEPAQSTVQSAPVQSSAQLPELEQFTAQVLPGA